MSARRSFPRIFQLQRCLLDKISDILNKKQQEKLKSQKNCKLQLIAVSLCNKLHRSNEPHALPHNSFAPNAFGFLCDCIEQSFFAAPSDERDFFIFIFTVFFKDFLEKGAVKPNLGEQRGRKGIQGEGKHKK